MTNATNLPVTVDLLQEVKPGYEKQFEAVLSDLINAAEVFEGYLGANVFRPNDHGHPEYRIIYKFDSLHYLHQWERSLVRRKLLKRLKEYTVGPSHFKHLTGLETWFTLPGDGAIVPPPRYKMMLISFMTIFPLSNLLGWVLAPILQPLPVLLRSVVSILIMLILTTYVVMPRVTKLFAHWLYPPVS